MWSIAVVSFVFDERAPKTTRTVWPLRSPSRGMMTMASRPIVNSPGSLRPGAVGVAQFVQPVDQLPRRYRLAAPGLRTGRANTRGSTRCISPWIRASIIREKTT